MLQRTWHLTRARIAMARRTGWPVASLFFHALVATVLALLVRDELGPFPHALFALAIGALVLALPLLSDLGAILRLDEGREWIGALPAGDSERTAARVLHLLVLLAGLVLAWFVPFAALAPAATPPVGRVMLPLSGFGLALCLATVLIWAQAALLARLEGAFLVLQTGAVVALVVGLVQILGHLPEIAALTADDAGWLPWFPPTWFARPCVLDPSAAWLPLALTFLCAGALLVLPASDRAPSSRRRGPVEALLLPLRRLAQRLWLRADERGAFGLVFAALPREREVALRTYPLLGIPLAFLLIGARDSGVSSGAWRGDLLALLFFTVEIYLPLLLVHVPLTESHAAAWMLHMAPQPRSALVSGTIKALFVRWILPLYVLLLALALGLGEVDLALRLWLPALLLALCLLRVLYERCVSELPLSTSPESIRSSVDWAGMLTGLAVGLTLLAVLANRGIGLVSGFAGALGLLVLERVLDRRLRKAEG